ncbi:pre-rRNA-processing protein ESF1 KNAG_0C04940 [Huiozyma naganishii CBS 8797]|uniref:Uncharacterized protein n=1 Tax=Huiozyma naganishii (strain ATCC MYA-139 / BCRC 22969 / CBS 8797 / KCTC 17520 / NBRC 10181 / NCYC 3082 / Yp74L-3) TaxID=1071383 RepID=J7R429_HUIN7|nr:hypothetical protein KNAG_0C04940 [Kazachstania naganishii CBS 8797]CCK69595.1 hypothetical protein KNAG_0C04940 [Kazachstania naganishii CBS 8797]
MSDKMSSDPRFSGVYNDPKFRSTKEKKLKVKLDSRFSKKDLEVKKKAKVDKYGRKIKNGDANKKELEDFDKYFEKEDEAKESEDAEAPEAPVKVVVDRARGEVPDDYVSSADEFTSSDSESSGSSESESESEQSDVEDEIEANSGKPESGDPSKTLAVVNLDWDHVKSVDLMITFTGFIPKGGKIERICIYPSEFGKERLNREEKEGPPKELFHKKKSKKNSAAKSKGAESGKSDDDVSDVDIKDLYEEGDAEKDIDSKALRQYQLERLRYFYAVVYCNNVETAKAIYDNCDATEYESTANMFDLRYVPEGMTFDDDPRDECEALPKNYKPLNFATDALQHSNVKLTWDETPADRVEIAKRAFSQKEIDDMDFKAYLASDSEDSDAKVDETMKNRLKALVGGTLKASRPKGGAEEDEDDEEGMDMEITFTPGLDEAQVAEQEAAAEEESTIDKIRRKEKERRKNRKQKLKELKKNAEKEKRDKLKSLKKGRKNGEEEPVDDKAKAELELLMMDEDEERDSKSTLNKKMHFNMNEIMRSEKEKKKKSKFQDKNRIVEDEFKPDLSDDRFKEVFEDHDFAIDPSRPEFKETPAMQKILQERSNRARSKGKKRKSAEQSTDTSDKTDISQIVSKLKRKKKSKTKA